MAHSSNCRWRTEAGIALLTLATIAGAEGLMRHHLVQGHFWVAVLDRMGLSDWAIREPAQLQYENLHPDDPDVAGRGISIFGSSQSAVNLDRNAMAKQLDRPVYRRALNGMFALEMCSAQYLLASPRTETAVFYMSPMDLAATTSVRADWMRSLISPQSWMDVVRALGPELAWRNRGPMAEMFAAAHLRLWSYRDGIRWLLFNLTGRTPPQEPFPSDTPASPPPQQSFVIDPDYVEASFRGYGMVLENLKRWGFDIVVFQGEVNPDFRRTVNDEQWKSLENRLATFLQRKEIRQVPLEEYHPDIEHQDWADNTHLNTEGQRKLTTAVIQTLRDRYKRSEGIERVP